MSLQSLNMSSFNLSISIFEKGAFNSRLAKGACHSRIASNSRPFLWPRYFYQIYNGKIEKSQISNCVTYWNAQTNPTSTVTELLSITLKNEILKAIKFYQY